MNKDDLSEQETAQNATKSDKIQEYKFSGSPKTIELKNKMIKQMIEANFHIGFSCKQIGISRATHYEWLDTDEEYKRAIEDTQEYTIDEYETLLKQRAYAQDTTAITFFLKTKGRARGYGEVSKIELEENTNIKEKLTKFKELTSTEKKKFLNVMFDKE